MASCETANPCPNGAQAVQPTADRIISPLPHMVADAPAKPLPKALGAPPPLSPEAPADAYRHGDAHWERATIFEDLGLNAEALIEYRAALTKLDRLGVHHIRVARFFRRLGLLEEAAEHFRRCMTYSHRYFAEFILPPLEPPRPTVSPMVEVIHTNRRGEQVVFCHGAYFSVPQTLWPVGPNKLEDVLPSEI